MLFNPLHGDGRALTPWRQLSIALLIMAILPSCSGTDVPEVSGIPPASDEVDPPLIAGEVNKDSAAFLAVSARQRLEAEGQSVMDIDVQSYSLKGRFDWTSSQLAAQVEINMRVLSDAGNELVLDSRVGEVLSVEVSAPAEDRNLPFRLDKSAGALVINKLDLPTDRQGAGSSLSLKIRYVARADGESTLHAIGQRTADPISSRVVYTTSEPLSASTWMPCHNSPSDRARFNVELTMPKSEQLVANGRRVSDWSDDLTGERTVAYATDYSLPTYLMAFALGEFQVTEIISDGLPISVWARRGLPLRSSELVEMLALQIRQMSELLIPYPFEKYALVLLPRFPAGGIEHASVTFQAETRSTEIRNDGDYTLSAHELAHHWFGDYVTVRTWDDLWIKEGMATLIASELRHRRDHDGIVTVLPGRFLRFSDGQAMRDRELKAGEKYTSGPYGRAAWYFNQLRSLVGETAFWNTMRRLLTDHAWDVVGSDDVLRAFSPLLTPEQLARASRAIDAKALPRFEASDFAYRVVDEESSLVVPMDWSFVAQEGRVRTIALRDNSRLLRDEIEKQGTLSVYDPRGVHPRLSTFGQMRPPTPTPDERISPSDLAIMASFGSAATLDALEDKLGLDWMGWSPAALPEAFTTVEQSAVRTRSWSVRSRLVSLVCQELPVPIQGSGKSGKRISSEWIRDRGWSLLGGFHASAITLPPGLNLSGCLTETRAVEQSAQLEIISGAQNPDLSLAEDLSLSLMGYEPARPHWVTLLENSQSLRARQISIAALENELEIDAEKNLLLPGTTERQFWDSVLSTVARSGQTAETLSGALSIVARYASLGEDTARAAIPAMVTLTTEFIFPDGPRGNSRAISTLCGLKKAFTGSVWDELLHALEGGSYAAAAKKIQEQPDLCHPAE